MILPRKTKKGIYYLSYSQIKLWITSPDSYRKQYYHGQGGLSSSALSFGKKIATQLEGEKEDQDPKLKELIQYDTPEQPINIKFDGFVVIGFIDSFDSKRFRFIEYKTGVRSKAGTAPWNISKVYKHLQLAIYSLAIKEMFGKVEDVCHLDWIETKSNKMKDLIRGGVALKNKNKNLNLTGHIESFARTITEREREDTKSLIIRVANEINDDYELYR